MRPFVGTGDTQGVGWCMRCVWCCREVEYTINGCCEKERMKKTIIGR